jgi:inosine-uridine nucleoside N-ribohydrolase
MNSKKNGQVTIDADPTKAHAMVLDVDTGRDDAWEIFGALRHYTVKGVIASYGNVPLSLTSVNTLNVVSLGQGELLQNRQSDIPVWKGEAGPLPPPTSVAVAEISRRAKINGNGLLNLTLPPSRSPLANSRGEWVDDFKTWLEKNGPVDYVISGPATNLARLVETFGREAMNGHINRVVKMGGSFDPDLSVDFNFKADPRAAQIVLSAFGEKVTLVPYDETRKLKLTEQEVLDMQGDNSRVAEFSRELMLAYARGWSDDRTVMLHDPATLLAFEDDATATKETIRVIQEGQLAGKTVPDRDGVTINKLVIPEGKIDSIRDHLLSHYLGLTVKRAGATPRPRA